MANSTTDAVKVIIVKEVVQRLMAALLIKAPFLTWGLIGWLVSELASRFVVWAIDNTVLGINLLIIDQTIHIDIKKMKESLNKAHNPDATQQEKESGDKEIEESLDNLITIGRSKL